jgi:Histone methylation protein DOT1
MSNSLRTDKISADNREDSNNLQDPKGDTQKITPSTISATRKSNPAPGSYTSPSVSKLKKELFGAISAVAFVTPAEKKDESTGDDINSSDENRKRARSPESTAKRRLFFGNSALQVSINSNVRDVYKIVQKRTGAIGGNGSFGPIYGELTAGSMQKMVNLMKEYSGLDSTSLFMDIGSGIGKPNLHVSQDPGVCISLGIESEKSRWILSMNCLQGVVDTIVNQRQEIVHSALSQDNCKLQTCNCLFVLEDVLNVHSFDPFSHVYMFSIGYVVCVHC